MFTGDNFRGGQEVGLAWMSSDCTTGRQTYLETGMTAPRPGVLVVLMCALFAAPLAARAQPAGKHYRVGVLCPVTCAVPPIEAFRQGLLERGYVEGRTITFEYRSAEGQFEKFADLAAELVARQVDVIVAPGGLPGVLGAKRATTTIPIVFTGLGEDPVQYGLVQSLARPGGNVTGLVGLYADLSEKQLELITETVPGVSRVAALWDVGVEKALEPSFKSLEVAARALGVQPQPVAVHGPDDLARAFRAAADARAGALILLPSPTFFVSRVRMATLATEYRLPTISPHVEFAQAGGLMAYGPNVTRMFGYAAGMVDRILKGAKPADLPVEQPTDFALAINLKTAKALGLKVPPAILIQANEVIR
jgi:putative tryptophan/tyrosine transport system substrate-binding protein